MTTAVATPDASPNAAPPRRKRITSALSSADAHLIVLPWPDPAADAHGHDARGRYAELFVLPILGPTATWLLRRLVDGLEAFPNGYELDLDETARALGLKIGRAHV